MADLAVAATPASPLSSPTTPDRADARRLALQVAALVLLAFSVRAALAWRIEYLPSDGVYHISVAQRFESGDAEAMRGDPLNFYSVVLSSLHRLGLDWFTAAKVWGVGVGTLAVLPIFGWIRREFDERTALWGALLYAVHPKLVEWSPEPLRDPTYWCLLAFGIYLGRRAVRDRSLLAFALAGLAWALAAHTRGEGWFLIVPLVLWTGRAFVVDPPSRRRLALGGALCLAMLPCVAVGLNSLAPTPGWRLGGASQLHLGAQWLGLMPRDQPAPSTADAPPVAASAANTAASPAIETTAGRETTSAVQARLRHGMLTFLITKTVRGLGTIYALLIVAGVAVGWRRLLEFDQAALLTVAALSLTGLAVVLWTVGNTSGRYAATAAIVATPFAALGAQAIARWIAALATRLSVFDGSDRRALVGWTSAALAGVLIVVGTCEGVAGDYTERHVWATVGRRLNERVGDGATLVICGPRGVGYYAEAVLYETAPENLTKELHRRQPQVVLIDASVLTPGERASFDAARAELGFEDEPVLTQQYGRDDVRIYVRKPLASPLTAQADSPSERR